MTWTPKPWVVLETGYDHWFKGTYLDGVANPPPAAGPISTDDSDYFYVSVSFRI